MDMKLASKIDHTLLNPEATEKQIKKLCKEAKQYSFASVCVNPIRVKLAKKLLTDLSVKICTVVGFPLGANVPAVKAYEAKTAVKDGADEVDMVINIGALKDKDYSLVLDDIRSVVEAVDKDTVVKVILENCLLENSEIEIACKLCEEAGADFVKTSTGFNKWGAKVEDVALMKKCVGNRLKIKAAGGIHDYKTALSLAKAGADRIGASRSIDIVNGK